MPKHAIIMEQARDRSMRDLELVKTNYEIYILGRRHNMKNTVHAYMISSFTGEGFMPVKGVIAAAEEETSRNFDAQIAVLRQQLEIGEDAVIRPNGTVPTLSDSMNASSLVNGDSEWKLVKGAVVSASL